jgi:hypothetical protein
MNIEYFLAERAVFQPSCKGGDTHWRRILVKKCQQGLNTRDSAWRCEHDGYNITVFKRTLNVRYKVTRAEPRLRKRLSMSARVGMSTCSIAITFQVDATQDQIEGLVVE